MILWFLSCQNLSLVPNVWNHSDCVFESPTGGQSDSFERRLLVAHGIELHVALKGPGTGQCLPLVVIMPPGLQAGTKDIETDWSNALVELGYWVLHWDPRGRGESTSLHLSITWLYLLVRREGCQPPPRGPGCHSVTTRRCMMLAGQERIS